MEQPLHALSVQTLDHSKAQPDLIAGYDMTVPAGLAGAHGKEFHPMSLAILDQRGGGVKTHRLIVQETGKKFRSAMGLEISRRIGQMSEADRVRFREAIQREGTDSGADLIDGFLLMTLAGHGFAQFLLDPLHF